MRILLDCSRISIGGAIQAALAVLAGAADTPAHEWHVVLSSELGAQVPREDEAKFRSVVRLQRTSSWRGRALGPLAMPARERAARADVVFSVFGPVYWRPKAVHLVGYAWPHLLYPEVKPPHSGLQGLLLRGIQRLAARSFSRCDYLVAETETVRQRLERVLGFAGSRVFVVRNTYSPIFERRLRGVPRRPAGGRFTVLVPSAYYTHKNLECVPLVARELEKLGHRDVEFLMTLRPEGPGWRRVGGEAERLHVADRVRNLGNVPHAELAQIYRQADAVFLPTLLECSTAVYPESFLAEVPLVTSDRDFAREFCSDGALYVDPLSPGDSAGALARLMTDSGLRQRLTAAGGEALRKNYLSPAEKWRQQLAILEQLGKERAGGAPRAGAAASTTARPAKVSGAVVRFLSGAVEFHDGIAPDWERKEARGHFGTRLKVLRECTRELDLSGRRWLDAGCGSGVLARALAARGAEVWAVDASPRMLEAARRASCVRRAVCFEQVATIEKLAFPDRDFDGVLCSSVLEYLDDPESALREFARVLRPGGHLVCSVPNRASLVRRGQLALRPWLRRAGARRALEYLAYSRHQYQPAEFARLLEQHGFAVRRVVLFGAGLPEWLARHETWGSLAMFLARRV